VNVFHSVPAPITNLLAFLPAPNAGAPGTLPTTLLELEARDSTAIRRTVGWITIFPKKLHFFGRYTIADFDKPRPRGFRRGGRRAGIKWHFLCRQLIGA